MLSFVEEWKGLVLWITETSSKINQLKKKGTWKINQQHRTGLRYGKKCYCYISRALAECKPMDWFLNVFVTEVNFALKIDEFSGSRTRIFRYIIPA